MQNISNHGGKRRGAGRPKGSGRYGEPTVPVRVPAAMVEEVHLLSQMRGRALPCYDMQAFNEPLSVKIARALSEKIRQ